MCFKKKKKPSPHLAVYKRTKVKHTGWGKAMMIVAGTPWHQEPLQPPALFMQDCPTWNEY